MARATLNLGILAHVDAGKTTLTERLLYEAGVIDTVGSVDAGTTRTDSMALERQRGITIRAAVVAFDVAGVRVNLVDTPGHPDFIAEVERVLSLLDGAVLVVSAVEGVQPQTRVLARALRRLGVPTLVFVNKIDRPGADPAGVLAQVGGRLGARAVPMGTVEQPGRRAARFLPWRLDRPESRGSLLDALADGDDRLLAAFVADETAVTGRRLRTALAAQTRGGLVHPVFFGSAVTGAGVAALRRALVELLPCRAGDTRSPASGRVFAIDRNPAGERIAYVRMFTGSLRTRQRLPLHTVGGGGAEAKPTAIRVAEHGDWVGRPVLAAGEIGQLSGLAGVRIGDTVGAPGTAASAQFPPPTLQSVVSPVRPADGTALRAALAQLAEQDPLIGVQSGDGGRELSVRLYGEVQREVLAARLADEYGIEVTFRRSTTICVERPAGTGTAVEYLGSDAHPFRAGIGLRVEPGPPGSGIQWRMAVEPHTIALYVYKSAESFADHMRGYVLGALDEGRYGWRVTDAVLTMVHSDYSVPDGPPSRRGRLSTATDFRNLTPMVVARALDAAGTLVCEPLLRVSVEIPARSVAAVLTALGRLGAAVRDQSVRGDLTTIETVLPAPSLPDLQRRLPGLTGGEGVLESAFAGYRPVAGASPTRRRTSADPLNRAEYLATLSRQGSHA